MIDSLDTVAARGDSITPAAAAARARLRPESVYYDVAELFRALGDPTRARIVDLLATGELCVGDLAAALAISEPAASQHLRLLRQLRLVHGRREGKTIHYRLDDDHVKELFAVCLTHLAER